MKFAPFLLPLALSLPGCASSPDGVWLFYVTVTPDTDATCADNLTHNFEDGWWKAEDEKKKSDDEEEWTTASSDTGSEWIFVGLVTSTGRDTATLVANDLVYPGTRGEDGTWTYTWTWSSASTDGQEHESGYEYTVSSTATDMTTFTLPPEQEGLISGTLDNQTALAQSWEESDTWDDDLAKLIPAGQIPAATYLYTEDDKGNTIDAFNSREDEECSDDPCTINYTETCMRSYSLRAEPTDLEDADAYDAIENAGEPPGITAP